MWRIALGLLLPLSLAAPQSDIDTQLKNVLANLAGEATKTETTVPDPAILDFANTGASAGIDPGLLEEAAQQPAAPVRLTQQQQVNKLQQQLPKYQQQYQQYLQQGMPGQQLSQQQQLPPSYQLPQQQQLPPSYQLQQQQQQQQQQQPQQQQLPPSYQMPHQTNVLDAVNAVFQSQQQQQQSAGPEPADLFQQRYGYDGVYEHDLEDYPEAKLPDEFETLSSEVQESILKLLYNHVHVNFPVFGALESTNKSMFRRIVLSILDAFFQQEGATIEALVHLLMGRPADGKTPLPGLGVGRALFGWYKNVVPYKPLIDIVAQVGKIFG